MSYEGDQTAREVLEDLKEDGQQIIYDSLTIPADPEAEQPWDSDHRRYDQHIVYAVFDSRTRSGVGGGHMPSYRASCYIGVNKAFVPKQYDRITMLNGKEYTVLTAETFFEQDSTVIYRLELADG